MIASDGNFLAKVPGVQRVREWFDGLAPRERTLLLLLVGTILGVAFLGGAAFLYERIDTLESAPTLGSTPTGLGQPARALHRPMARRP